MIALGRAVSRRIAKHHFNRRRILHTVLHRGGGGRVVEVESGSQGRLTAGRNGQRAATTRSNGRSQRRRDGQTLGVGHLGFDIGRCVTCRGELESVALGSSPVERHREPVDHRRRCRRGAEVAHRRVIGQALNGVIGSAGERDLVIVDGQFARVLDAHIEVTGAGTVAGGRNAALRHLRGTVDAVEQVRTEITVLVDALSLDTVHLIGDDQRHTTQFIHGRIEHFAAITQQAADFTTGHDRGDVDGARTTIELQRQASRIIFTRHRLELVDRTADHQWLAATQIHIDVAVALDILCAGEGRQLAHGFVAGIEQFIRRTAGARNLADFLVQLRQGRGQLVDLICHVRQVAVDVRILRVQLAGHGVEAIAQGLGIAEQQLAGGVVAGFGIDVLYRGEEFGQGTIETGATVGQQGIEWRDLPKVRGRITVERRRGLQLRVEVAVVYPAHIGQRRAGADVDVAVLNRPLGALHGLLA
ncbi:hypothetical protein D3C71_1183120 [compost metagenome]